MFWNLNVCYRRKSILAFCFWMMILQLMRRGVEIQLMQRITLMTCENLRSQTNNIK
jgi:hypothetical protein